MNKNNISDNNPGRGDNMYCKICGENKKGYRVFSIYMCRECMSEIAFSSVYDEEYNFYINIVRILLGYYIGERELVNPAN